MADVTKNETDDATSQRPMTTAATAGPPTSAGTPAASSAQPSSSGASPSTANVRVRVRKKTGKKRGSAPLDPTKLFEYAAMPSSVSSAPVMDKAAEKMVETIAANDDESFLSRHKAGSRKQKIQVIDAKPATDSQQSQSSPNLSTQAAGGQQPGKGDSQGTQPQGRPKGHLVISDDDDDDDDGDDVVASTSATSYQSYHRSMSTMMRQRQLASMSESLKRLRDGMDDDVDGGDESAPLPSQHWRRGVHGPQLLRVQVPDEEAPVVFQIEADATLIPLFQKLRQVMDCPQSQIKLTCPSITRPIKQTDSINSAGIYPPRDILTASIVLIGAPGNSSAAPAASGGVEYVVVMRTKEHTKTYKVGQTTKLGEVKAKFCAETGLAKTQCRFSFDGDPVKDEDTASSLDFEEDEQNMVDVHVQT